MSEKYKEYCMKFSNEEIRAYMVDYLFDIDVYKRQAYQENSFCQ